MKIRDTTWEQVGLSIIFLMILGGICLIGYCSWVSGWDAGHREAMIDFYNSPKDQPISNDWTCIGTTSIRVWK